MLYGTSDSEPQTDIVVAQLSQELYNSGLLVLLIQNLSRVDFEVSSFSDIAAAIVFTKLFS
jgi:calcium binding protein 39